MTFTVSLDIDSFDKLQMKFMTKELERLLKLLARAIVLKSGYYYLWQKANCFSYAQIDNGSLTMSAF